MYMRYPNCVPERERKGTTSNLLGPWTYQIVSITSFISAFVPLYVILEKSEKFDAL